MRMGFSFPSETSSRRLHSVPKAALFFLDLNPPQGTITPNANGKTLEISRLNSTRPPFARQSRSKANSAPMAITTKLSTVSQTKGIPELLDLQKRKARKSTQRNGGLAQKTLTLFPGRKCPTPPTRRKREFDSSKPYAGNWDTSIFDILHSHAPSFDFRSKPIRFALLKISKQRGMT